MPLITCKQQPSILLSTHLTCMHVLNIEPYASALLRNLIHGTHNMQAAAINPAFHTLLFPGINQGISLTPHPAQALPSDCSLYNSMQNILRCKPASTCAKVQRSLSNRIYTEPRTLQALCGQSEYTCLSSLKGLTSYQQTDAAESSASESKSVPTDTSDKSGSQVELQGTEIARAECTAR